MEMNEQARMTLGSQEYIAHARRMIIGFKALVKTFNDYEERVDNLSALIGLAGASLEWLSQKAKDLSTATLEGGIRVTQGAHEIFDAFTKAGVTQEQGGTGPGNTGGHHSE